MLMTVPQLEVMQLLHITYLSNRQVHALVGVNAIIACFRGASVLRILSASGKNV